MWVHTQDGFYSVVQSHDNPNRLMVRARSRADLEALVAAHSELKDAVLLRSATTDYPWRIIVARSDFAQVMLKEVLRIEYSNFKNRVARTKCRERVDTLHTVWDVFRDIEDETDAEAPGWGQVRR